MNIDVRHIAKLSMLRIPEDKVATMENELSAIVQMVENLPDVGSVDSLLEPDNLMELREDEVIQSISRDELLQNVPHTAAGCIVVPKTVE